MIGAGQRLPTGVRAVGLNPSGDGTYVAANLNDNTGTPSAPVPLYWGPTAAIGRVEVVGIQLLIYSSTAAWQLSLFGGQTGLTNGIQAAIGPLKALQAITPPMTNNATLQMSSGLSYFVDPTTMATDYALHQWGAGAVLDPARGDVAAILVRDTISGAPWTTTTRTFTSLLYREIP